MKNKDKAQAIVNKHAIQWIADFVKQNNLSKDDKKQIKNQIYNASIEMIDYINELPIIKQGGWHTEIPKKDCCVLLEWGNERETRYDIAFFAKHISDCGFWMPNDKKIILKWERWKLIDFITK